MFLITKKNKGGGKRLLEAMDMFTALILVMVSQVYTYLQTHQVVYIKYVQTLYVDYTSIKLF